MAQGRQFPGGEVCPICRDVEAVRHPGRLWQCPACGLVFSAFRSRGPDLVTYSEARLALGHEGSSVALSYRFHHTDDHGRPYWTREEYERVVRLLEIEHPHLVTHPHSSKDDVKRRKGPRPVGAEPGPMVDTSTPGSTHAF